MSNKAVLQQAVAIFKQQYPGLTAEAIICFIIIASSSEKPTVGDVARATGMAEPTAYQHISMLTGRGAGLVTLENAGDGRNHVQLSSAGEQLKSLIDANVSA